VNDQLLQERVREALHARVRGVDPRVPDLSSQVRRRRRRAAAGRVGASLGVIGALAVGAALVSGDPSHTELRDTTPAVASTTTLSATSSTAPSPNADPAGTAPAAFASMPGVLLDDALVGGLSDRTIDSGGERVRREVRYGAGDVGEPDLGGLVAVGVTVLDDRAAGLMGEPFLAGDEPVMLAGVPAVRAGGMLGGNGSIAAPIGEGRWAFVLWSGSSASDATDAALARLAARTVVVPPDDWSFVQGDRLRRQSDLWGDDMPEPAWLGWSVEEAEALEFQWLVLGGELIGFVGTEARSGRFPATGECVHVFRLSAAVFANDCSSNRSPGSGVLRSLDGLLVRSFGPSAEVTVRGGGSGVIVRGEIRQYLIALPDTPGGAVDLRYEFDGEATDFPIGEAEATTFDPNPVTVDARTSDVAASYLDSENTRQQFTVRRIDRGTEVVGAATVLVPAGEAAVAVRRDDVGVLVLPPSTGAEVVRITVSDEVVIERRPTRRHRGDLSLVTLWPGWTYDMGVDVVQEVAIDGGASGTLSRSVGLPFVEVLDVEGNVIASYDELRWAQY
jgi:hypothetical protein